MHRRSGSRPTNEKAAAREARAWVRAPAPLSLSLSLARTTQERSAFSSQDPHDLVRAPRREETFRCSRTTRTGRLFFLSHTCTHSSTTPRRGRATAYVHTATPAPHQHPRTRGDERLPRFLNVQPKLLSLHSLLRRSIVTESRAYLSETASATGDPICICGYSSVLSPHQSVSLVWGGAGPGPARTSTRA